MYDLIEQLSDIRERRIDGALCMIVKTEGSTPLKGGALMLVRADGSTSGTIGGGALEHAVIAQALETIPDNRSILVEHRLVRDHNMCCGGTVQIFIRAIPVPEQLFLFGAGHVGSAVARVCEGLGFDSTVIDGRAGIFDGWRNGAYRIINAHPHEVMASLAWDRRTYVVIATHSHPLDREILAYSMKQPHAYCGMIGSARKVAVTRRLFLEQHLATDDQLDRVDMPIGIDIAAMIPEEIAVSIAARLIAVRRSAATMAEPRIDTGPSAREVPPCIAAQPEQRTSHRRSISPCNKEPGQAPLRPIHTYRIKS
jgi:xanthine dehydrogenase accessory factor